MIIQGEYQWFLLNILCLKWNQNIFKPLPMRHCGWIFQTQSWILSSCLLVAVPKLWTSFLSPLAYLHDLLLYVSIENFNLNSTHSYTESILKYRQKWMIPLSIWHSFNNFWLFKEGNREEFKFGGSIAVWLKISVSPLQNHVFPFCNPYFSMQFFKHFASQWKAQYKLFVWRRWSHVSTINLNL